MKIAYLTNIPSPYRTVMMEAWAARLGRELSMELAVYFTDEGDQGRGWSTAAARGVREERLPTIVRVPGYGRLNRGLWRMVRDNDVVMIGGFEQASYLAAACLAWLMRRKVILLFDGFSPKRIGRDPAPVTLVKRLTGNFAHACFANGRVGREVMLRMAGARDEMIFNQYLSVSTCHIDRERQPDKDRLRAELGLPAGRPVAAFCGYLIARKRPDLILEAVAGLDERPVVLFIGRGPRQEALERQASALGVEAVFSGFREGSDLARHYLASDFLILPSDDDPWGLVVNEAMAAGLPVIASDACGATPDLVIDGITGFSFAAGDAADLRRAISAMLSADRPAMGEAVRACIAEWTPEHSARSLAACVRYVLKG